MSSINRGLKLALKRIEVALTRFGPDHYIFESEAMRETAVLGRGIARSRTSVAYLGVDTSLFRPAARHDDYAHAAFDIPRDRHIVYYSGHMQQRKGVAVIMRAAVHLVEALGVLDVHFLLLGNRPGEEEQYHAIYRGTRAENHVTFGGYRRDVADILRGCSIGTIASTGWDSFTMSSLEIASTGLPLVVSRLQGLTETIEEGVTGHSFPVGDHVALAAVLRRLLADDAMRTSQGAAARERVLRRFTLEHQTRALVACCTAVAASVHQRPQECGVK
jgi:glycosyltransferase involved in cell wall biosynthesis